jgi:hypothetical protein
LKLLLQSVEQFQNTFSNQLIQCRRNFIADNKFWLCRQCTGDTDSLFLATGKFSGIAINKLIRFKLNERQSDP